MSTKQYVPMDRVTPRQALLHSLPQIHTPHGRRADKEEPAPAGEGCGSLLQGEDCIPEM